MLALNNLRSSGKKRKRIGRGGARGGTSGRGFGGQKARTGAGVGVLFEGGQMPLIRRLPKRGFSNARFAQRYDLVTLDRLNELFDAGAHITHQMLLEQGLVKGKNKRFKVLAKGTLNKNFTVHAHAFSGTARQAIEEHGGKAILIGEM